MSKTKPKQGHGADPADRNPLVKPPKPHKHSAPGPNSDTGKIKPGGAYPVLIVPPTQRRLAHHMRERAGRGKGK